MSYNYMHIGALSSTHWGGGVASRSRIMLKPDDARELVHLETGLNPKEEVRVTRGQRREGGQGV